MWPFLSLDVFRGPSSLFKTSTQIKAQEAEKNETTCSALGVQKVQCWAQFMQPLTLTDLSLVSSSVRGQQRSSEPGTMIVSQLRVTCVESPCWRQPSTRQEGSKSLIHGNKCSLSHQPLSSSTYLPNTADFYHILCLD